LIGFAGGLVALCFSQRIGGIQLWYVALWKDSESMGKRIADFFRSDLGVLVFVAALRLALHCATNGCYGFHRDELQTLDDARHLDWGF
jgi:hypothetical protein